MIFWNNEIEWRNENMITLNDERRAFAFIQLTASCVTSFAMNMNGGRPDFIIFFVYKNDYDYQINVFFFSDKWL